MTTPTKNTITSRLAVAVSEEASRSEIPQEAIATARACLLDTIGVAVSGRRQPIAGILEATISAFQGAPQSHLWTRAQKAPMHEAALFNGTLAHALDFDDMHIVSAMHPSAPVFAAALAVGEHIDATGASLLRAAALGIEAEVRIGASVNPSHYRRGWHATGTLGHFGAVIAAASLLGLSTRQTVMALGIAGTQASGLKSAFGTMTKPLHAGIAARNGVMAAVLARQGFTGSSDILGGVQGFGHTLSDSPDWETGFGDWNISGGSWLMYDVLYKVHASSFCTQALIEAVLMLKEEYKLEATNVRAMHGEVSRNSIENARIIEPVTGMEAKFSLPHAMAQAISYAHARVEDFTDERVCESGMRRLRGVTCISLNDRLEWPEAIAYIELVDGRQMSRHVDLRQQTATAKDKWRVAEKKFLDVTSGVLSSEDQQCMLKEVERLGDAADLQGLLTQLSMRTAC